VEEPLPVERFTGGAGMERNGLVSPKLDEGGTGLNCLPRSSRNCFAATSISMQQFHQTRFIRKTFCQRLIERCQTWWRKSKG
jgi:hypothetical protein